MPKTRTHPPASLDGTLRTPEKTEGSGVAVALHVRLHRMLFLLLPALEAAGFQFSPDRVIRLKRLLVLLPPATDGAALGHALCPIFATDAKQQADFLAFFRQFHDQILAEEALEKALAERQKTDGTDDEKAGNPTMPPAPETQDLTDKPTDLPPQESDSPLNASLPAPARSSSAPHRPLVVELDRCTDPPYTWNIVPDDDEVAVETGGTFGQTLLRLRRRETSDTESLDIAATVEATIENGGRAELRYRRHTRPTEYLLLVERFSAEDHRAGLFDYFFQTLRANEVLVERYFYQGDLRICRNEQHPAGLGLPQLRYRYPDARLLVVGTGYRLLSPATGELSEWAEPLHAWRVRVLLTPIAHAAWGQREEKLAEVFSLLPASLQSLHFVAESPEEAAAGQYDALPEYIRRIAETQPLVLAEPVLRSLRQHFDPGLQAWIAACAIYPALHFDLTLRLGRLTSEALGYNLVTAANLLALARLPWFTAGQIPPDVRNDLVDFLEARHPALHARVIEYLHRLLDRNPPPENSAAWAQHRINLALLTALRDEQPDAALLDELRAVVKRLDRPERRGDFVLPKAWGKVLEGLGLDSSGRSTSQSLVEPKIEKQNDSFDSKRAVPLSIEAGVELFKDLLLTITGFAEEKYRATDPFGIATRRYIGGLIERYNWVKVLGMREPVPLKSLYVRANILEKISARAGLRPDELAEFFDFDRRTFGKKSETVDGERMVNRLDKFIVLGKPGAGKTTYLKFLTLMMLDPLSQIEQRRLPIFISIREWADERASLLDFIVQQFDICGFPDVQGFVEKMLAEGQCIVLFDGLDEVSSDANQDGIIRQISDFTDKYAANQFVMSCRVAAYNHWFERFTDVEMADFNEEQIAAFIHNWFYGEPKVATECWERLKNSLPLRELASVPLLLTLLCLEYSESNDFPPNHAELYERAIETLLTKWDSSRRIRRDEVYKKLTVKQKKEMFARIAFGTFSENEYFIRERTLAKMIEKYIENLPGFNPAELEPDSRAILQAIAAQHGIFVERAKDVFSFAHLIFQEYFTAKYIVDNQSSGSLEKLAKEHLYDPKWKEVFLLVAGMLDDADELLLLLLREDKKQPKAHIESQKLILACLDSGGYISSAVREKVLNEISLPSSTPEVNLIHQSRPKIKPDFDFPLPEMIPVQGGTFRMGEKGIAEPAHPVTLPDFEIGKYPVTQKLWSDIMGNNPSHFKGDDLPVESVSWDDCQEFLKKLNARFPGKNYRLPTEAEWEYAARGGAQSKGFQYSGSDDLKEVGWFWENSGDKPLSGEWKSEKVTANNCRTHPVGQKKSNELGLHDMSGNVWEWCNDWYGTYPAEAQTNPSGPASGSNRVIRGGSCHFTPASARVANRNYWLPDRRDNLLGFRLARTR